MIAWLLAIIITIYNVYGSKTLAAVNSFACNFYLFDNQLMVLVFWNIGSFVVVSVALLVVTRPKQSAKFVFTEYFNNTGWDNTYYFINTLSDLLAALSLF